MDPTSPFPRLAGNADASVRPALPHDAAEIARVQLVTWRTAYRASLPAAVLDDWDAGAATARWRSAIDSPPTPGHGVVVALERNALVGFAAYGPAELTAGEVADPAGPTAELGTLLVEPRWGRRGHGSRLLAAVSDLVRADGAARLQTWLIETDRVSAAFLESAGWGPDGWARTLDTGGEPLREIRWHALLDDPDATPREAAP
ncbi:GNAT family N-acetyltransferase [Blastococcus haudaquaticus]|uniref:Protein N-acetyltransferase, RimJ/RimL family n=1 Tax=Blastococcus haudaquaticus TaxID=1938745 RepID=A0A286H8U1_9ACTN|nr:GNAT family N-acetyltransferase [Blastococcus haudaquaticus]SOE04215.1 Protein N-acetyltransferase, RimJ/RimL family [Blastococcus haudaquaticus]